MPRNKAGTWGAGNHSSTGANGGVWDSYLSMDLKIHEDVQGNVFVKVKRRLRFSHARVAVYIMDAAWGGGTGGGVRGGRVALPYIYISCPLIVDALILGPSLRRNADISYEKTLTR